MIYAINEKTKEHVDVSDMDMPEVAEYINGDEWYLTHADADGWIPWHGGECPLPCHQPCDVMRRDGQIMRYPSAGHIKEWKKPITYYRPLLEEDHSDKHAAEMPCEAPEWDGETWPPPVGSVVESFANHTGGMIAEVLAVRNGHVIGCTKDTAVAGWLVKDECRPLRTPAQRAEDEAVEELAVHVARELIRKRDSENIARALYRAGYRKVEDES